MDKRGPYVHLGICQKSSLKEIIDDFYLIRKMMVQVVCYQGRWQGSQGDAAGLQWSLGAERRGAD